MKNQIGELMTRDPVKLEFNAPLTDAAEAMRRSDVGDVLITKDGELYGILTDRDIVVRGLTDGRNPAITPVGEVCSKELNVLKSDASAEEAVRLMREKAIRRIPVVQGNQVVGIISMGDLAQDRDEKSALASVSAAPANR